MNWLKSAAMFQILTDLIHSVSFFISSQPQNETERQMLELMKTYKLNAGFGFSPTRMDLFLALSACFTLAYLLGGALNFYLIMKGINREVLRGVVVINIITFGSGFLVMYFLTFIYPVVLTGLVFVLLVISYFFLGSKKITS